MSDDLVKRLRKFDWVLDELEIVDQAADHIEQLAATNEELKAKLAKLTKAADRVHDSYWNASDGIIVGMFDLGERLREARTTLAELKGDTDE